ncbi:MAG: efflux transporter outer membrane subunit [Ignavibacteriaceae bacterium]
MNRRLNKLSVVALFFLGIILYSCAVGPDFQKPETQVPKYFTNYDSLAVDTLVNLKWWEIFNDPILDTLVLTALQENKNVNIAIARIEEARANFGFTEADIYPRFDIQGEAKRGNYAGSSIQLDSETNGFFIAPVVNWEIDFWGKFRRANESAQAQYLASEFSLRKIQISLISEVVSTYFLLLDYRERLKISESTLKSRMESLRIIQERFDKGIVPEIDLNQAQIQKEIAATTVPLYKRLAVQTENSLSILLGKLPTSIKSGTGLENRDIPPDIPTGLPSQLLVRRPDIAESEYLLQSQNAQIGVAVAKMFPSISLTGLFGLASDDLSTLTVGDPAWSISGTLLGPLFNFGKNTSRVEVEEAKTQQVLYQYEYTVINAFREVEDALIDVQTYKEQLESLTRQYIAAKNAEKLSRMRYDLGVTSYLEVLESERTLFNAELQLSEIRQATFNSYIRLYKALGGGWISKEEYVNAKNDKMEEK